MSVSDTARTEIEKPETTAVFLHLLALESESFEPVHLVDNTESVVSGGITYIPCGFTVTLPAEGDGNKACRLEIDNIEQSLSKAVITAVRQKKKITAAVSVVMAQTPDTIERGPLRFILRNVEINKSVISGELYDFYIYDRKTPEGSYNPQDFQGLF
jgi:hypothetical protein